VTLHKLISITSTLLTKVISLVMTYFCVSRYLWEIMLVAVDVQVCWTEVKFVGKLGNHARIWKLLNHRLIVLLLQFLSFYYFFRIVLRVRRHNKIINMDYNEKLTRFTNFYFMGHPVLMTSSITRSPRATDSASAAARKMTNICVAGKGKRVASCSLARTRPAAA